MEANNWIPNPEDLAQDEIDYLNAFEGEKKLFNFLRRQFGWDLEEAE